MNRIGIDCNAVGNQAFDEAKAELLRMPPGGVATGAQKRITRP